MIGVITPILCPPGTFSTGGADSADTTILGATGNTPCTQCPAGSFCPVEGTKAAVPCGVGYFSPPGS